MTQYTPEDLSTVARHRAIAQDALEAFMVQRDKLNRHITVQQQAVEYWVIIEGTLNRELRERDERE